jgi:hypothetical protein
MRQRDVGVGLLVAGAGVAGWWGAFVPIHIRKGLSAAKNGGSGLTVYSV